MSKKNNVAFILVIIFGISTIIFAIQSIQVRNWKDFRLSFLALVSFSIPFILRYIANKKKIVLPSYFQEIGLIFLFLTQYLGELRKFYLKIWWWDLLLHIIFGIYAVLVALYLTQGIIIRDKIATVNRFRFFNSIFSLSFSIALGTFWEIFEFLGDVLFKTNMVKGGLEDTLTDLIVHLLAAFLTSVIYYYHHNMEGSR